MITQPGTYFVVRTDGWVGSGIRWFEERAANEADREGAWANHAGVVVDTSGGIIEAQPTGGVVGLLWGKGVRRGNLSAYAGCRLAVSTRPLTDAQRMQAVAAAEEMLDIPYNVLDIAAMAASTVGTVPEPVWDRLNRGDRLICSQVVARVQRVIGDPVTLGPDCRVTPAHLARVDILGGAKP